MTPGTLVKWQQGPATFTGRIVGYVNGHAAQVEAHGNTYEVALSSAEVVPTCAHCNNPIRGRGAVYCSLRCVGLARSKRNDDAVFAYLVRYKEQNDGLSPTVRQIQDATYLDHTPIIASLRRLAKAGRIAFVGGERHRTIMITGGKWIYTGVQP